jgi:uncharacterized membrane protein
VPSAYTILKTVHVLAAVIWVGGAFTLNLIGIRTVKAGGAPVAALGRTVEWLGKRLYLPTSLVVLVAGIAAALVGGYDLRTPWLVIGMVGVVATTVTGSAFLGPESKRVAVLVEQRGHDDPEYTRRVTRILRVARIDLAVLFLMIIDMTVKPGF